MTQDIKNILIVDDDAEVAEMISRILSRFGYRTVMAFSMEDALMSVPSGRYNLVITDVFMKGMGGIEGIREIRASYPDLAVIATSGGYGEMSAEDALRAAAKLGVSWVLPKPFEVNDLRDMVSEALET